MNTIRIKSVVRNVVEKSEGTAEPFIGLEDVEGGTGRLLVEELPVKAAGDSICHRAGDVLFSKLRPYLAKSYLARKQGTGTGELLVLRPGPRIDARFLLYVTLSTPWVEWANTTAYGTKMPRTSWELVGDYRTLLPSLEEQCRIADFLDVETARIDRLFAVNRRLRAVLSERRDAYRSLALRGSSEVGPRDIHPVLGAVPASWPVLPLKRLVPRIGVGVVVDPSSYFADEGVPFLRGSNITEQGINLEGVRLMSEADSRKLWRSRLAAGDVVVIRAGYPGRAAVIPPELDGANCASLLVVKRGTRLLPEYLEAYFNSPLGRAYVDSVRYGAAQEQINVSHVVDFMVPSPTVDKQREIVAEIQRAEKPIRALGNKLSTQESLLVARRQALITAAVTGQFDVSTASGRNVTEGITA